MLNLVNFSLGLSDNIPIVILSLVVFSPTLKSLVASILIEYLKHLVLYSLVSTGPIWTSLFEYTRM